jgi:hypothetical protein
LTLAGGAASLLDAGFRYNVDTWQPQVEYGVNAGQGTLAVTQPGDGLPVGGELVNAWDLRLSNSVPLDLVIQLGAGEGELDLSSLALTGVQVETGAGTVQIDLRGDWSHDVNAAIRGGAGDLSIMLPSGMGVRVSTVTTLVDLSATGLTRDGDVYVNAAFG